MYRWTPPLRTPSPEPGGLLLEPLSDPIAQTSVGLSEALRLGGLITRGLRSG